MSSIAPARDAILGRLRAASRDARPMPDVAAHYRARGDAQDTLGERFIRNARAWHAEVIETSAVDWPRRLAELIEARALQRLLAGRQTAIADRLAVLPCADRLRWYDEDLADCKHELFTQVEAGISTTLGAIAETGSLLLRPGQEEPRTLSLLPPLHIAVVEECRIHPTLFDAWQAHGVAADMPSNLLLVTGPSKTADIQRMLVYGVHGPRELVILLIREPANTGDGA